MAGEVLLPHGVFADAAIGIGRVTQSVGNVLTVEHTDDVSVGACGERLTDAVYQQGVVGACIAVGQQIVRIGKVHIMTYCMIDGFAAVVQVEGVLIGMCVAAGTERAGTEAEADIMLIVFQVVVGYHFAGVFEPYGFGGIRW